MSNEEKKMTPRQALAFFLEMAQDNEVDCGKAFRAQEDHCPCQTCEATKVLSALVDQNERMLGASRTDDEKKMLQVLEQLELGYTRRFRKDEQASAARIIEDELRRGWASAGILENVADALDFLRPDLVTWPMLKDRIASLEEMTERLVRQDGDIRSLISTVQRTSLTPAYGRALVESLQNILTPPTEEEMLRDIRTQPVTLGEQEAAAKLMEGGLPSGRPLPAWDKGRPNAFLQGDDAEKTGSPLKRAYDAMGLEDTTFRQIVAAKYEEQAGSTSFKSELEKASKLREEVADLSRVINGIDDVLSNPENVIGSFTAEVQKAVSYIDQLRKDCGNAADEPWVEAYGGFHIRGADREKHGVHSMLFVMPDYPESTCAEIEYIVALHNHWPLFRKALAVIMRMTKRAAEIETEIRRREVAYVRMQPVFLEGDVPRFRSNRIVVKLLATHSTMTLNSIAEQNYSDEERQQLAQLIGYSVQGYGELSYHDLTVFDLAEREGNRLLGEQAARADRVTEERGKIL